MARRGSRPWLLTARCRGRSRTAGRHRRRSTSRVRRARRFARGCRVTQWCLRAATTHRLCLWATSRPRAMSRVLTMRPRPTSASMLRLTWWRSCSLSATRTAISSLCSRAARLPPTQPSRFRTSLIKRCLNLQFQMSTASLRRISQKAVPQVFLCKRGCLYTTSILQASQATGFITPTPTATRRR